MTTRIWLIDVLPDGTGLTSSNMLDTDGNGGAVIDPRSSFTSSTTHVHAGTSSMKVDSTDDGTTDFARLPYTAAHNAGAVSFYHYMSALPSATLELAALRFASGYCAKIRLNTDGTIGISESTGGSAATSTATLTVGQWNRIESVYDITAGDMTVNAYVGDATGTSAATATATGANLTSNQVSLLSLGDLNGHTNTQWFDSIQMSDSATSELGPYIPASTAGLYLRYQGQWVQVTVGS